MLNVFTLNRDLSEAIHEIMFAEFQWKLHEGYANCSFLFILQFSMDLLT